MSSRKLSDLRPELAAKAEQHVALCASRGIDLLVTCTYRSNQEQAELYAIGRTTLGNLCRCNGRRNTLGSCLKHPLGLTVTNAKPGESRHNGITAAGHPYAEAYDVVPVRGGKCVWDDTDPVWQVVGELGEFLGLEWAGRWQRMKEFPHFQWRA